jgi:hypothetical protein
LDFDGSDTALNDIYGTVFIASANPLLDSFVDELTSKQEEGKPSADLKKQKIGENSPTTSKHRYIELKPGGASIKVDRSNRAEFVQLFVNHALYGSCKNQIDDFLRGVKEFFFGPAVNICTATEVIDTLSRNDSIFFLRLRYYCVEVGIWEIFRLCD